MLLQVKSNVIYVVKTIEEKSLQVEPNTKSLYDELLKHAIRVVSKGSGMPQFFNDKAIIKAMEDLGISHFDKNIFEEKIKQIIVPNKGALYFIFKDGSQVKKTWNYPPRSESWTEEMKKMARENETKRLGRVKMNEHSKSSNSNSRNA